jgi:dTDP-4-dehydrorhamnose 3,5-epimerase
MIDGIIVTPLRQIHDERGKVMHMLRETDSHFERFGEVYFSWIYPNVLKAWHKHNAMIMNYAVPVGAIKVVLCDDRPDSNTYKQIDEYYMNPENYYLLTIPNGIWYGFKSVNDQPAMIANCSTIAHDPAEIARISHDDPRIAYSWDIKHG